jgi:hypothetical protein
MLFGWWIRELPSHVCVSSYSPELDGRDGLEDVAPWEFNLLLPKMRTEVEVPWFRRGTKVMRRSMWLPEKSAFPPGGRGV